MIETVQEGLGTFKAVLRDYAMWVAELETRCNEVCNGRNAGVQRFSNYDREEIRRYEQRIASMAGVLGLTKDEQAALEKERGVVDARKLIAA